MKKLFLIRHGATAGNLEKRYIGRTDEPLCPEGIRQALYLREQGLQVDCLFVSPALRARQTAELVFPDMPYLVRDGLMETNFGVFEGKTAAELGGNPAYQAWVDSGCTAPIPGGESVDAFKARCCHTFQGILEEMAEECSAALVMHGGGIMAILEAYACPAREFYTYHIPNGAYVGCRYTGGMLQIEGRAFA